MSDWRAVMARMAGDLGITWPVSSDHIAPQAADFLAPEMRHHVSSTEALEERADLAPWFKEAFRWARNAASGQPGDTRELDRLRDSLRLADMVFQPVLAANRTGNAPTATAREQQVTERDALIAELHRDLGAAEVCNGALAGGIVERDAALAELRRDLAAAAVKNGALAGGIVERDGALAELRRDLAASEERRGLWPAGFLERDTVITELRSQVAATTGQVSSLREELDERMKTLHALQRQLSEAAARFTERLLELRRSAGAVEPGAASPTPGPADTGTD